MFAGRRSANMSARSASSTSSSRWFRRSRSRSTKTTICASCTTKECIRGSTTMSGLRAASLPDHEREHLDCTFCLDCVHSCPHDNVGILAVVPGKTLWSDPFRSGIGRFSHRTTWQHSSSCSHSALRQCRRHGWPSRRVARSNPHLVRQTSSTCHNDCLLLPIDHPAAAGRRKRRRRAEPATGVELPDHWTVLATRDSFALVPIGFAMWLAHYSFHLFSSYDTIIAATQRFAADHGYRRFGDPQWKCGLLPPRRRLDSAPGDTLMLDFGLFLSLYTGFRIAESNTPRTSQALKVSRPGRSSCCYYLSAASGLSSNPWKCQARSPPPADQPHLKSTSPNMQSPANIPLLCCLLLGPCCAIASADGGRVVLVEKQGDYRIPSSRHPIHCEPAPSTSVSSSKTLQPTHQLQMPKSK